MPRSLLLSGRLYHCLLRAYPADFRHAFGSEMELVFRDGCRAALEQNGWRGLSAYGLHVLVDLIVSSLRERLAIMDKKAYGLMLLAALLGLWIGWVDFHSNEVQNAVLLLVISGFVFGLLAPRRAWRWALALGLGVPLVHYVAYWRGLPPPFPVEPGLYASFLALIPAFIGTYSGVFLRHLFMAMVDA